jgi:hypothetical protein
MSRYRYQAGLTALIAAAMAYEAHAWLGPRRCPACRQPRTVRQRIRGTHRCVWTEAGLS